jgi:hypothetical protein
LLLIAGIPLYGQLDTLRDEESSRLEFRLENINFVKNNEYFNPVTEGYTLIGYFLQPSLVYSPSKKISIRLGTHILNYSGAEKTERPELVFSTTYFFSPQTRILLGTLDGSDKHRLPDPIYNSEKLYTDYTEEGLSFKTDNKHLFSDTWIDWQNFIFKGDTTREVFDAGESFVYKSGNKNDAISFQFPVNFLFRHFGGQISNYSSPVTTWFNFSTGVQAGFTPAGGRYGSPGIEYRYFLFSELNGSNELGFTKGSASWLKLSYSLKMLNFSTGMWWSENFYAPGGKPVFSSRSDYNPATVIPLRKIWTSSINLNVKTTGSFSFFLGFDSYYDLNLKRMDTSATLHLRFDGLINILRLKN